MYSVILKLQINHDKFSLFTLASLAKDLKLLSNYSYHQLLQISTFSSTNRKIEPMKMVRRQEKEFTI